MIYDEKFWERWASGAVPLLEEVSKGPCARGRERYADCVWQGDDDVAEDPDACLRCRARHLLDCLLEAAPSPSPAHALAKVDKALAALTELAQLRRERDELVALVAALLDTHEDFYTTGDCHQHKCCIEARALLARVKGR